MSILCVVTFGGKVTVPHSGTKSVLPITKGKEKFGSARSDISGDGVGAGRGLESSVQ